ncbi:unnamed protein product [Didymodactylos carnosus]|uniref:Uncharacterized protein n=1 Tax=Didymodactylos carnosus TaxID=1234261 RepID=A0A8S2J9L5_9BILA|nr:unnamed protein product [Didymodactylos carnosus]CAF3787807.1 unnamed protein product [Didymodactylos carnosus]
MGRLDCSLPGRSWEKFDHGFAVYVSYLHMEVAHTNPVMLAFCYSLYDDIIKRRQKDFDDDEDEGETHSTIVQSSTRQMPRMIPMQQLANRPSAAAASSNMNDNDGLDTKSIAQQKAEQQKKKKNAKKLPLTVNVAGEKDDEEEQSTPQRQKIKIKNTTTSSNMSTAYLRIDHSIDSTKTNEMMQKSRKKRARFRWYLAYSMLNNYQLYDMRKNVQSRLVLLRVNRSNSLIEMSVSQQTTVEVEPNTEQRRLRMDAPAKSTLPNHYLSLLPHHHFSVPAIEDYPQSPIERYTSIGTTKAKRHNNHKVDYETMTIE